VFRSPWLLLAGAIAFVLAILLVPTVSARLVLALVSACVAGVLLSWYLAKKKKKSAFLSYIDERTAGDKQATEIFALGKLFQATMSGMREGLLVVDRDMSVVASNRAAHHLFALADGNLDSQRLTELTRNPAIYSAFLEALKGEERSGVKVEAHGPDRRIFDLRVVPLKAGDGNGTQGAIGVFFDITRLEQLERVRQEFLSNVSHELRTPLTAILAFVETLETGSIESDEDRQRFLAIIRRNATRMHNLIDDILELSAIEAGNVAVKSEQIELHAIVSDVFTSLAARASARQIILSNRVDRSVVVFADARRLEQMLTNLIDNAIKFNREGGSVIVGHENGLRDRIFVEDTGEGIPKQHLQRLFERFYRVDRARSRELGGTGLGLAIVKHLARAHEGEISVESQLGEGSRFAIDLPKQP
jgi:two-component system, OmpR family, phosphate regulon sensor histidine kinase PhoR